MDAPPPVSDADLAATPPSVLALIQWQARQISERKPPPGSLGVQAVDQLQHHHPPFRLGRPFRHVRIEPGGGRVAPRYPTAGEWGLIAGLSLVPFAAVELSKLVRRAARPA